MAEMGNETVFARWHGREKPPHLTTRENGRKALRPMGPLNGANVSEGFIQNVFVEESQRMKRLGLNGRSDARPGD